MCKGDLPALRKLFGIGLLASPPSITQNEKDYILSQWNRMAATIVTYNLILGSSRYKFNFFNMNLKKQLEFNLILTKMEFKTNFLLF
jgi:hypothetical protein